MREQYEFRLLPHAVAVLFGGQPAAYPVATVVRGEVGDKTYLQIEELHRGLQERGEDVAFGGWLIRRIYSLEERAKATTFWLDLPIQNASLEEGGTSYDDGGLCAECGIGAVPTEPLIARTSCFKGQDVVCLLSGEILISEKTLNVLRDAGCSGFDVLPILESARESKVQGRSMKYWLLLVHSVVQIDKESTRFGADPFDLERRGSCTCNVGEIAGYAPLSALRISGGFPYDIALSDVYVGTRRGLLRPYRLLFVSKRVLHLMEGAKLRGICAEPVL